MKPVREMAEDYLESGQYLPSGERLPEYPIYSHEILLAFVAGFEAAKAELELEERMK